MTTTAANSRSFFVNIPVADVARSKAFFGKLGFGFKAGGDDSGAVMLLNDQTMMMLLSREKFAQFAHLPTADPKKEVLSLYCFGVGSRAEVDAVAAAALDAGGKGADGAEDFGFMYSRSFFDLDGHGWQVMWMDPAAQQGPGA